MNYNNLKKILMNSERDDWLFNDQRGGVFSYKEDLHLRIVRNDIDHDIDQFEGEDWANQHPDPRAYRVTYEVYYGSTFVEDHLLVTVDGFRATLPLPKIGTNKVSSDRYNFAKLVDDADTLDDYMRRANLEVEE